MSLGFLFFVLLTAAFGALLYESGGPSKEPGLVIAIAFLVLFDLGIYWSVRRGRKHLQRLAQALDGGSVRFRGGLLRKRRAEGQFLGRRAELRLTPGGKQGPGYLTVRMACLCPASFFFWRAAPIQLGGARDLFETGSAALDRDCKFRSKNSVWARSWLLEPGNSARVAAMLHRGTVGTSLELSRGTLEWAIHGPNSVEKVMEDLSQLALALEQAPVS